MGCITDCMTRHHRECDGAFRRSEEAVDVSDWPAAERHGGTFLREMAHHIEIEEDVLFPAFEEATGMTSGPTAMMRIEHAQLRELFARMHAAIQAKDAQRYQHSSGTVLVLLQQHNMKEEAMLYPMLDRALGEKAHSLLPRLETVVT